jgi:hypothetical protein
MTELEDLRYKKKLSEENIALCEVAIKEERKRIAAYNERIQDITLKQERFNI